eukprot:m.158282 g.158282  ORF g.158282 m.158282 type:complete len:400 (+) comp17597_c0_seq4:24-1223(+)
MALMMLGREELAVAAGTKLLLVSPRTGVAELLAETTSPIVVAATTEQPDGIVLALEGKKLIVLRRADSETPGTPAAASSITLALDSWLVLSERAISKRPTAMTTCAQDAIVADKTGEIYRFSVTEPQREGELIAGHVSMVLDLAMSSERDRIISADRDDRVRVSRYPRAWNIESFCFGHKEFVTSVCAVPHVDPLLVSGSGDGTVRLWEAAGQQLDIVDLRTATAPNAMVRQVCVTAHYVAVIATRIQGVVLVPFDRKGGRKFAAPVTVALNATPARIFVDPTGHLWVLVLNDTMPLRVLTVGEACDAQEASDETICACVQKFAGLVGPLTAQALCAINLSEITKTAADRGAESYFARKEERLKGKEAAGQKRGEDKPHVSAGPTKRARPDNKAQGKKQ